MPKSLYGIKKNIETYMLCRAILMKYYSVTKYNEKKTNKMQTKILKTKHYCAEVT